MARAARLLSRSAIVFGMRLAGAALAFAIQLAIARAWGAELFGRYLIVVAVVNLLAFFMPLGFQVTGTYFAAEYGATQNMRQLRAYARRAYIHIALSAAVLTAFSLAFGEMLSHLFPLPQGLQLPMILLATATAIVFVSGSLLLGMKRSVAGFVADALFRPLTMLSGIMIAGAAASADAFLTSVTLYAGYAYLAVALLHAAYMVFTLSRTPNSGDATPFESRRWWRYVMPWIAISLATDFFFDIDLIMLSTMTHMQDIAVFGLSARIFALVVFATGAIFAVTIPDAIEAQHRYGHDSFYRRITDATILAAGLSACAAVAACFSGPVLSLFGAPFAKAAWPLAILCAGLTVRLLVGPGTLMLALHDRPNAGVPPVIIGLAALFLANIVLAERYGPVGAASAVAFAMIVWSFAQWIVTFRQTGRDVSLWPRVRELATRPRLQQH